MKHKADLNFTNEHGNTPLHYACFWAYGQIAEALVYRGAKIALANKYGETPLDKCNSGSGALIEILKTIALENGQDLQKIKFKDQSYIGLKTRSRDATLSRHKGINIRELDLRRIIGHTRSGVSYFGIWQQNEIVAKKLAIRKITQRISRDFNEEFPKLRIFSHPNILPVIGCCNNPEGLYVISQYLPLGSLYNVLHESNSIVVDTAQAVRFAIGIARGMAFLHSLERTIPEYHLNSRHVVVEEDLTARINMADAKFSFQEKGRIYYPAWMSPEALQKKITDRNWEASDMWSFAVVLWELATREVPFVDLSPMEVGMRIALEGLRILPKSDISPHLKKMINICMNEDPGKRPKFDQIVPILDKMTQ